VKSVPKKKRNATVGRVCKKRKAWSEKVNGVIDDESGESMELMEEVPIKELDELELERLVCG